jgi:hypothetical protein
VILFTHRHVLTDHDRATLHARGIAIVDGPVARLVVADDRLRAVQLADGRTVPRAALFIRPAVHAHRNGPAEALGCELVAGGSSGSTATGARACPASGRPATPPPARPR